MANYTGTPGDDFYFGTEEADVIVGLSGVDNLFGAGGDDVISGGNGADDLSGGAGDDVLNGNQGDDILRGGTGKDRFNGGEGFDRISFFDFTATQGVIADLRRQLVLNDGFGNRERMTSIEGLGAGTVFADRFYGDDAKNLLYGGRGDMLFGFGGDDELNMRGAGGATVDGGDGVDLLIFVSQREMLDAGGHVITENAIAGVSVDLTRNLIIDDGFGERGAVKNVESLFGADLADRLIGNESANVISGLSGDDRIVGLDGNDILQGDEGNDVLNGGRDDDYLFGFLGDDRLYGEDGADTLFGYDGADYLNGGAGEDIIMGGYGVDRLIGGAGSDVFLFYSLDTGRTIDTADLIVDFEPHTYDADGTQIGSGDVISLRMSTAFEPFAFIGTDAFSMTRKEVRYEIQNGETIVFAESGDSSGADLVIRLTGVHELTAADFIL